MLDAVLIQQCADSSLKPAIVEQFIAKAGSQDPLAVTVRSGNRVVLVPKPITPEEALALIRDNLGRNTVRVGITQYPAGLGIVEAGQLKPDMVEPCENIRMGTALFAKVFRIVSKWYGNPTAKEVLPQVTEDAVIAWQTGYFEGVAVFRRRIRVRRNPYSHRKTSPMTATNPPTPRETVANPRFQRKPPCRIRTGRVLGLT